MVHNIDLSPVICFDGYVQARSRKTKSKIGIGIPSSQSKIYPVAPASLILFVTRIFAFILSSSLDFVCQSKAGCLWLQR
jgi:hypothetical protein